MANHFRISAAGETPPTHRYHDEELDESTFSVSNAWREERRQPHLRGQDADVDRPHDKAPDHRVGTSRQLSPCERETLNEDSLTFVSQIALISSTRA